MNEDELKRRIASDMRAMIDQALFGSTAVASAPTTISARDILVDIETAWKKFKRPDSESPEGFMFPVKDSDKRLPKFIAMLQPAPQQFIVTEGPHVGDVPIRLSVSVPYNTCLLIMKDKSIKIIDISEITP